MYRLLFQNHLAAREPVVTGQASLLIGRDPACHLRLTENGIREHHAVIERRADGYYVRELQNANSVRVNGATVAQHRLDSGDALELGSVCLRFEVLHDPPARRRGLAGLPALAALVVAVIMLGELAWLGWIFTQPHPVRAPQPTARVPATAPAASEPAAAAEPAAPVLPAEPPTVWRPPLAAPAAGRPPVLDRMLRIDRVTRSVSDGRVLLTLQVKAQVGERDLDTAAARICVQFLARRGAAEPMAWRPPLWLSLPRWENFTTKIFLARLPDAADQLGGYVVRTYYRHRLQDVAADSPALLAQAPEPLGGR